MFNEEQWDMLLQSFLAEAEDLLKRAEASLEQLQAVPNDSEAVNELFRAAHTMKGSAGLLGLSAVVGFTHEFENVLMQVRDGDVAMDGALVELCFRCLDYLAALIDFVRDGGDFTADPNPERASELLVSLRAVVDGESVSRERLDPGQEEMGGQAGLWHISLRFDTSLFVNGFDPASFLRYLQRLGTITDIVMIDEALPREIDSFDPERCYLGFEVSLDSTASKAEIESVFEFILDLAEVRILPPDAQVQDYVALIQALPEDDLRLGEMLVRVGAITENELQRHLNHQRDLPEAERKPLGEQLVTSESATPPAVEAALGKQRQVREKRSAENAYLRVSARKMDELINQVGELVIAAAGARLKANQGSQAALQESLEDIHLHVEQIREAALQLRMVEIGESFNRFHRVVREASENLGKRVRLAITGAETELDKTLVDRLHDPLVHLVRNAMDHGLETTEMRCAAGKPEEGTVSLNAYHESGMIVIEVSDDGRGIDVAKVRAKALEQGLIGEQDELDDDAVAHLIFQPGFSTAAAVTNLSGRGVGMDSVRRDIDALRGTLEIDNRPGQGCCFRIRLPLTLAIIDGFLVGVGDQYFVVPLDAVNECVESGELRSRDIRTGYRELRGRTLPYINLHDTFDIAAPVSPRQSMVVVSQGGDAAGLLVDELHGEVQTVIKPLGSLFDHLSGFSGATILGSGRVALILDIPGLLRLSRQSATEPALRAPLPLNNHHVTV